MAKHRINAKHSNRQKDRAIRKAMCTSKRDMKSKEAAEEWISEIQTYNNGQHKGADNERLHAYECPYCSKWHVGHKNTYWEKHKK